MGDWAKAAGWAVAALLICGAARAQSLEQDWRRDAPGVLHRISPTALPPPYAERSASNGPSIAVPARGTLPRVPQGFSVQLYASGLRMPRILRTAPNGDVFVAESGAGRIRVLRGPDGDAKPQQDAVFAAGLDMPFGLAFWPPGPAPQFLYVANNNSVVRFAYRNGDLHARAAPADVVAPIAPTAFYHWTRDIAFSPDGRSMYLSVGSASNVARTMPRKPPEAIAAIEARFGVGAAWGDEESRADVLVFDPDGGNRRVFATGLRNCSGLAVQPQTHDVWCSTNERDGLGDNLPPDYVTPLFKAGSTAGRGSISAATRTRSTPESGPTWSRV
jgi:glucose/arabinose dehydrogenase